MVCLARCRVVRQYPFVTIPAIRSLGEFNWKDVKLYRLVGACVTVGVGHKHAPRHFISGLVWGGNCIASAEDQGQRPPSHGKQDSLLLGSAVAALDLCGYLNAIFSLILLVEV